MNVRYKSKHDRKIAEKVAGDITKAIQGLSRPEDNQEIRAIISACASLAYQWSWQNSDRLKDMAMDCRKLIKDQGLDKIAKKLLKDHK